MLNQFPLLQRIKSEHYKTVCTHTRQDATMGVILLTGNVLLSGRD